MHRPGTDRGGWRRLAAPRAGLLAMNVAAELGSGSAAQDVRLTSPVPLPTRRPVAPCPRGPASTRPRPLPPPTWGATFASPARQSGTDEVSLRARRRALESQEPDSTTRHALSDADFVSRESNERKKTSHAPQFAHSDGCLPNRREDQRRARTYVPASHGRLSGFAWNRI